MPAPLTVSAPQARGFMRRATGLDQPFATVAGALNHLGYVQIDPIAICGRMHDLILRNRVAGYREGDLMAHLHPRPATGVPRGGFEHHHPETHILVAFPFEAWPHLLGAMRERSRRTSAWSGRLTPRERELAPELLNEIRARGPLSSDDFNDDRRAHRTVWGASSLVKSTLQKLFFHGRLLIAERVNNRRRYDLPDRILPPAVLAQAECAPEATTRWLAVLKLRQRRLATLKRLELAAVRDLVQAVTVEGCPTLYCLHEDVPALLAPPPSQAAVGAHHALFLAPLDPLIYDRRTTAALWNFNYTWEAYTPAARRVRGHYALPVLAGTELVGHVEPKADRGAGRLVVASRSIRRGYKVADALDELARWLGLRR